MLDLASLRDQAAASKQVHAPWWAREIKAMREKAGLTPPQAAEKAGLTAAGWRVIERGAAQPRIGTLERMLAAVGGELEIMQS